MLEELLENKTKAKILGFFTSHPERGFYLQELKRKIGGNKLVSELNNLVKESILISYSKKSNKFFRLNKRSPQYQHLKVWARKIKKQPADELSSLIKTIPDLKLAVLTGIFIGSQKAECDALLVGKITQHQLEKFEKMATKIMGQEINYAVMEYKEYKMRKDTFDRFMKDVFENEHLVILDKIR